MSDSHQHVRLIGAKPATPAVVTAETPWGAASVVSRLPESDAEWAWGTRHLDCLTRFGTCAATLELQGYPDKAYPTALTLRLEAGIDGMRTLGEPAHWRDGRIAWKASLPLDPLTGRMAPEAAPVITLYEGSPDTLGRQEEIEDPTFLSALTKEIESLVEGWGWAKPAYAAVAYEALSRKRRDECEAEAGWLREQLLKTAGERDEAARMARAARTVAETGRCAYFEAKAGDGKAHPHLELRGFAGAGTFDDANLDEILAYGPSMMHLETMSETSTWMGVYLADGRRLSVRFNVVNGNLVVGAEIDDDGAD